MADGEKKFSFTDEHRVLTLKEGFGAADLEQLVGRHYSAHMNHVKEIKITGHLGDFDLNKYFNAFTPNGEMFILMFEAAHEEYTKGSKEPLPVPAPVLEAPLPAPAPVPVLVPVPDSRLKCNG